MHSSICGADDSLSVDQGRVEVPEYPTPVRRVIIKAFSIGELERRYNCTVIVVSLKT
jgi:hypothetical protein